MKEILTVNVKITGADSVKGTVGGVTMIHFVGDVDCEAFRGKVLPGGVDTQSHTENGTSLSARYILDGVDLTGEKCRIFIENNGIGTPDGIKATPRIITDSKALSYLETAKLSSRVTPADGGVTVHIFED